MVENWKNCIAIVTGASSGIGAEISIQLVKNGLKVVALARRVDRLKLIKDGLGNDSMNYYPLKCDMTKEEDILAAFEWTNQNLGGIHLLINNAGIGRNTNLSDGNTNDWKQILDTNLLGLCIATREAVKSMTKNNFAGLIIHINSVLGHNVSIKAAPTLNVYSASKFGVTAAAETLRIELAAKKSKIRVTSVSPGGVATEILESAGSSVKSLEKLTGAVPLDPIDVANAVLYLLSTPETVNVTELTLRAVGEIF